MHVWFWAWLVVAAAIAVTSAVARDRAAAPFAVGAACAAATDAVGLAPAAAWIAFIAVSAVLFVVLNRRRYVPRHRDAGLGRHSAQRQSSTGEARD
jgi:membrane protein implicated in regulation of membrane protease activity